MNDAQKIEIARKIKEEESKLARAKQLSKLKQNTVYATVAETEGSVYGDSTQTEENKVKNSVVNREVYSGRMDKLE